MWREGDKGRSQGTLHGPAQHSTAAARPAATPAACCTMLLLLLPPRSLTERRAVAPAHETLRRENVSTLLQDQSRWAMGGFRWWGRG